MEHAQNIQFLSEHTKVVHNVEYSIFVVYNEHANQGSQCSSLPTCNMVEHIVTLYSLDIALDNFAYSLSILYVCLFVCYIGHKVRDPWEFMQLSLSLHMLLTHFITSYS